MWLRLNKWAGLICLITILAALTTACKKKETEGPDAAPEEVIYGVAKVNGTVNEYLKYKYFLVQKGSTFENNLILFRGSQEKIQLIFRGTEEGVYKITAGDTNTRIRYYDAAGRMFVADSGAVSVAEFTFRNGAYTIAGGFAFNAFYKAQFADTSYMVKAAVRDGGFIPITNN
ncbi:MAG: hypothetical protein IT240_00140 [Bacteroidia bacterium]|nr:hypothetical protein [Bacteroidia bacterium]